MPEEPQVVIRDGHWLGRGNVYADFGDKEMIVALSSAALEHPSLMELPDNEQGQSVRTSREALHRATVAATHSKGSRRCRPEGRILVEVEDLEANRVSSTPVPRRHVQLHRFEKSGLLLQHLVRHSVLTPSQTETIRR